MSTEVSTTYDFLEVQSALNAWKQKRKDKKNPALGFWTHNFAAYNFSNESGLRHHYKRDLIALSKVPPLKEGLNPPPPLKGRDQPPPEVGVGDDKYGSRLPTLEISNLSNDDWIDRFAGGVWKADYLTELRDLIWDSLKGMYQVFRTGGKTFSCTGLFARWILEVRTEILCFTNPGMKDEIFRAVLDILQSEVVRDFYGDVVARSTEQKGIIICHRDLRKGLRFPNFRVIGNWAAAIGSHPGWIHIEDIIADISVSVEAERRLHRWFSRVIKFMKKRHTKVTLTGTRKDPADFYEYVERKHHFKVTKWTSMKLISGRFPTIEECVTDHDLELITSWPSNVGTWEIANCPEWTFEALLYLYLWHYEEFEAEMQNDPLPGKGKYFNGDDWIEVDILPDNAVNYMIVDPAFGQTDSSSKTAIIVLSIGVKMTIIDAYIGRLGLVEKADMVVDFHERHRPFQTLVEDNFRQITSRYEVKHEMLRLRGLSMIENYESKRHRIEALKFPYRKREMQILSSCPFKGEIKGEYLSYSQTESDRNVKTKYNALDSLSMGYLRLKHFIGANRPPTTRIGTRGNRFNR